jgi:hypothetical protein
VNLQFYGLSIGHVDLAFGTATRSRLLRAPARSSGHGQRLGGRAVLAGSASLPAVHYTRPSPE